jgi:predicted metal-dependent phosphotriesterase family hydrolase
LVAEGFGSQITLAGDLARKSCWPAYGQWCGPGLTYILWRLLPWLHERGLDAHQLTTMLVATPARLLQLGDVR